MWDIVEILREASPSRCGPGIVGCWSPSSPLTICRNSTKSHGGRRGSRIVWDCICLETSVCDNVISYQFKCVAALEQCIFLSVFLGP